MDLSYLNIYPSPHTGFISLMIDRTNELDLYTQTIIVSNLHCWIFTN